MTRTAGRRLFWAVTLLLALAGFLIAILTGPVRTTAGDLLRFVRSPDPVHAAIFIDLRLARAVLAFLVGSALALSGAILQGYFRNPMADPFVVGVSSGASLGAVVATALGFEAAAFGFSGPALLAFVTGLGIVSLVYALSLRRGGFKVETILLTGVAAGALASAVTSFFLFMRSDSYDQAVFWLLGSFQLAEWRQVATIGPWVAAGLVASVWLARDMDLLALGDESAQALGSPVRGVRRAFLAISALLAALSVAVSGVIGFVGLVVPHWVRLLIGPTHRTLFAASALAGGTFLLYCDLLARNLLPAELPIGVITAAVGAPFFIYLLHKKR
ncbi:MAG TPA: iron ABC transporter permease [Candidatus Bathyarchaeia archaeon]|nr:iron ABC transporter permease [Candidatus Bathyarchaeia archaeon]